MNLPVPPGAPEGTGDPERPSGADPGPADGTSGRARPPVTRKQLDDIFGEALPTVTQDELDDRDRPGDDELERWYRDNRPPHHG